MAAPMWTDEALGVAAYPVPLGRIEPLMLREWVSDMAAELSASRIRQAYRLLSAMFQAAVESGYLAKSPCVGVSLPRMPEQEMRFLDRAVPELALDHLRVGSLLGLVRATPPLTARSRQ